jgi:hypothetical protein
LTTDRERFAAGGSARYGVRKQGRRCVARCLEMIRFLLRLLGLLLLAGAFTALLYDGTKSIAGDRIYLTKLGDTWNALHSTSLQLLQPAIERHVAQWLWDPVLLGILTAPTGVVLGVLGVLLLIVGRRKEPLIGYSRD